MEREALEPGAGAATLERLPAFEFLPADLRARVAARFERVSFSFGSLIVREGDPADAFFVLVSGRARVVKRADTGGEIVLNTLRPGDSFGEMGLLEHTTRMATVRASADVEVLRLDQAAFSDLLATTPDLEQYLEQQSGRRRLHNFLRSYTAFARLPLDALASMLAELETVEVERGAEVIRQGDPPGPMYVVEEGRLRAHAEEDGERRYLRYLRRGDFFGELSLFKGEPRSATVEAVSPCRLLRLTEATFTRLLDGHPEFRAQLEKRIAQYDYRAVGRVPLDFANELLPAEASVQEKVGPRQVEPDVETNEGEAEAAAAGPFATPDGLFVKQGRRIRRFPWVAQLDAMDCAAAALAMVCRHFGRAVSLARIRQRCFTATDGTSLRAICRAASELGLAARPVKVSARNLDSMPLPAIVHWEGNHWVVLYDVADGSVRIADPALGLRRLPRADFEARWSGYTALLDYTAAFDQAPVEASSSAWLWPFLRPVRSILVRAVGLAAVASALQMVLPVFTQVIVDRVLVDQDLGLLHVLTGAMLAALVFMTVAVIVQRYLLSFVAVRVDAATLDYLTRTLLALPMTYFSSRRTGDIQRRLNGLRAVREFLVQSTVAGLTSCVQLVASLTLMLVYSPLLAGVFLATVPLYMGLMRFSARRLRPIFADLEEGFSRYASHQIDAIRGIETVKAMGAESAFRELLLGQFHWIARRQFRADFTVMCYEGAVGMVAFLTTTLFLWVGARQVLDGQLTIGALVAFTALVGLANAPITTLLGLWDNFQFVSVLLGRLDDVFHQEPEQGRDRSRLTPVRTLEGALGLRGLGFRYGGPASPAILDGITVDVPAGKVVAIVGRSGSGKTTLVKCLAGLLEPTEGTILYDGVDLRTLNYRDLRQQIGFVLQDNYLFDDTIERNIAFGDEEPDPDRVIWAARVANAHEFIERLPLGYETRVGESGLSLSGGQRQRVAIARAIYHQPPVLILDEATSSLDTESERAVKENIGRLLEGRTCFVIAHRLSTVHDADLILVLEKGRLVEQGSHDDLMKRQGLYFYLVSQQLGS
ncbi:MAG TPA: peptidase domain-containing ABC transporter [Candidatus Limnocylindrales bacterium]|nr:peptidase domain-containing ABC transporter [Candidatus Limnocylindrales bacterium]